MVGAELEVDGASYIIVTYSVLPKAIIYTFCYLCYYPTFFIVAISWVLHIKCISHIDILFAVHRKGSCTSVP